MTPVTFWRTKYGRNERGASQECSTQPVTCAKELRVIGSGALQITLDCKTCHWTNKQPGKKIYGELGSKARACKVLVTERFVKSEGNKEIPGLCEFRNINILENFSLKYLPINNGKSALGFSKTSCYVRKFNLRGRQA